MNDELNNIRKQIDAYVKGALGEQEIEELWVKFAKHPELLEELELEIGVKSLVEDGKSGDAAKKSASIKTLPTWTWHAAAAAILLLVAVVQVFQIPSKANLEEFVVASIKADQLETSDGIRSKDVTITNADSILNLGFNEFVSGNLDRALYLYSEVITEYDYEPYGSKAYLNNGIIYYNMANYDSAIVAFNESLSRNTESKMMQEKAYWYLGNSYANIGELEAARNAAYQAYRLEGVFKKPAFLLIQKLNYDLGYTEAVAPGQ